MILWICEKRVGEKPEISKKVYKAKPVSQQAIEEFLGSGERYATVKGEIVANYKSPATCARGFGRVIKTLGLSERIKVYIDQEKVYLELVG